MVRARYSSGGGSLAPPGGVRRQRFPYMFEFRQGTLLCRVIYYPSLPVSSSLALLHPYLGAHTDRSGAN